MGKIQIGQCESECDMKGAYCLIISVPRRKRIRIGTLGEKTLAPGTYAYLGSAQSGIAQRVGRHRTDRKRMRWHIDYLLAHSEVVSVIAIPCDFKRYECELTKALMSVEGAMIPIKGFGSSDCDCPSHLVFLGDSDPAWILESVTMRLSMLPCVYPRDTS